MNFLSQENQGGRLTTGAGMLHPLPVHVPSPMRVMSQPDIPLGDVRLRMVEGEEPS